MSQPTATKPKKKVVFVLILAVVAVAILMTPPVVYGGFIMPLSRITFRETTGSLTNTTATVTVQTVTAYEYMFSIKTGGMVRTTDTDVSSSKGTANVTMKLSLTNPSGKTLDLGSFRVSGAMGTRNHTIYLGADEGVRLPGSYRLDVIITADVAPIVGAVQLGLSITVTTTFTIS